MNQEYQRLIQRDQHPLTFLYAGVHIARSRCPIPHTPMQAFGVIGELTRPYTSS
jgi:hypothetical protein